MLATALAAPPRSRLLAALPQAVLAGCACVLAWCVAAGPHLFDAGELTAAAVDLGGSHPPGQPLHALLGHALALLPLGPIPARVALLSALCALGAAWVAGQLCAELCAELGVSSPAWRAAARAAVTLGFVTALPVLRQALRVEVYTLALLLYVVSARELFRWARDARAGRLGAAALAAGLAACVHPPHALAAALTGACFGVMQPRRLLLRPRAVAIALGFGLLGLLALVYLPLRARAGAPMWGDPQSLAGFLRYVSGQAFLHNIAQHDRVQVIAGYAGYLLRISAGVPFAAALLVLSPRVAARSPAARGLLLAAAAALLAAALQPLEERNPDNVAYLGPALALALIAGGAGLCALAQSKLLGPRPLQVVPALGLALIALPPASAAQLPVQLRADLPALETLIGLLVEAPPPRALVITTTDFVGAGIMQAQSVDRVRPDAALFVSGLSTSSWQWARLASHPGLDPRPRPAPGRDAHDRYTRGALLAALPRVPVALEDEIEGLAMAEVAGAFVVLDRRAAPGGVAPRRERSMGERWLPALARDAQRGSPGDSGAGAAIVRRALYQHSERLFARGAYADALASAALSVWDLPAEERALVRAAGPLQAPRMPFAVRDPGVFLRSMDDAVRLAAVELWALGERDRARRLLEQQLQRGDSRALLQLAYLQAFEGDREGALRTLTAFDGMAPALRAESAALRAVLAR